MKRAAVLAACFLAGAVVVGGPHADTVGPSLTLAESSAYEYVSGSTVYYAPTGSNSGTFTVTADATASSIASVDFPAVFGSDSATDTSSPFSHGYSWTSSATASGTKTVTVTDGDSDSDTVDFTVTPDTTAPSGQSVSLSGGPTYSTLSVPLTLSNGTDSGSGVDTSSGVVERSSATLSGGSCGSFGSYATVTLVGSADTTVTSGKCYRYRYKVSDNVGNQSAASAASADAKVDNGVPTVTDTQPTEVSGADDQYWNPSTDTLWFRPTAKGSFTLNATATDAASGVSQVSFPDISAIKGWSGSTGGTDTSSPYSSPVTYAWTAGAVSPGAKQVTATGGGGLTASDTITLSGDSIPPNGQSVDLSGGPWYSTLSVPLTLGAGTDAGSGIDPARTVVERASAVLTNGACGTFGEFAAAKLGGTVDTGVTSGYCYRYQSKATDNVGNVSTASKASSDAKIDATPPTAPSLAFSSPTNAAAAANVVFYRPGASDSFTVTAASTDNESGIASLTFPALAGFALAGSGSSRTYSAFRAPMVPPAPVSVTAVNRSGLTSPPTSFTLVPDSRAPSVTVRCNGKACRKGAYRKAVAVKLLASDGRGSGVSMIRYTTDGTVPTPTNGLQYRRPFTVRTLTHMRVRAYDRAGNASVPLSVTLRSLADRLVFRAPTRLNVKSASRFLWTRVSVTAHAIVTASMAGPGLKKPQRWRFVLSAGKSVVRFTLPRAIRPRGRYTLVWNVKAGTRKARKVSHVYRGVVKKGTKKKG